MQQNFQHAVLCGSGHCLHTVSEREFFADQALHVYGIVLQQIQGRLKTPATRANDADLIHHNARGVYFREALESRFQNQGATRTQQIQRQIESGCRAGSFDGHIEFPAPLKSSVVPANGVLYVTTETHLYAFKEGAKPAQ